MVKDRLNSLFELGMKEFQGIKGMQVLFLSKNSTCTSLIP
jgi:hypothetical protein